MYRTLVCAKYCIKRYQTLVSKLCHRLCLLRGLDAKCEWGIIMALQVHIHWGMLNMIEN
jgi:hypothetical protein